MKYLSIFIRVALLALGQSLDCHSASEVSLMDMGKSVNVYPQQSTAKQKPCAYFLGYTVIVITWLVNSNTTLEVAMVSSICLYLTPSHQLYEWIFVVNMDHWTECYWIWIQIRKYPFPSVTDTPLKNLIMCVHVPLLIYHPHSFAWRATLDTWSCILPLDTLQQWISSWKLAA